MTIGAQRKRHASAETLERGRLRRIQIIDAATELFANAGYRGTGLAGIAAQVGVTQAGLLHHFGSKERLLEAVVEHRSEQDAELIAEIMGQGGLGMLDRVPLLAMHDQQRPGLAQLFTVLVAENLLPEHPAHDFFRDRYRSIRAAIITALEAGQARGEIRTDIDLKQVAARLVAALDGLQSQWLLDPTEVDLVESYTALAESMKAEVRT